MLTQYHQGGCGCLGGGESWSVRRKPKQAYTEQVYNVDITKNKYRDISLPDGMGVPNRQAVQRGMGQRERPFRVRCIIASQTDF